MPQVIRNSESAPATDYVKSYPTEEEFVRLRLDFRISPAKTKALLGRNPEVHDDRFEYPGIMLWYDGRYPQRPQSED